MIWSYNSFLLLSSLKNHVEREREIEKKREKREGEGGGEKKEENREKI